MMNTTFEVSPLGNATQCLGEIRMFPKAQET